MDLERWTNQRLLIGFGLLTLGLLVFVRTMEPIGSSDLGWHVQLGRHIAELGAVPATEPFTHTAAGKPMVSHEWLLQLGYAGIDAVGGLRGLRVVHALAAALLLGLQFGLLRRAGAGPALSLFGAFAFITIAMDRFQVRPHVINIAFQMALFGVVFVGRPALTYRQLAGLFLAVAVWANLHSGATVFALFSGVWFGTEWVQQKLGWREPRPDDLGEGRLGRLFALPALSTLAVIATPNHLHLFPYLLESGRINRARSVEWWPLTEHIGALPPLSLELFALFSVAAVGIGVLRLRTRGSLSDLALVGISILLPVTSARFIWLAFVPVIFVLAEAARWIAALPAERGARVHGTVSAIALLSIALAARPVLFTYGSLEAGLARFDRSRDLVLASFPLGSALFLNEVELEGRLFNPAHWGGHLLYASDGRLRIFSDGRWITVGLEVHMDNVRITSRRRSAFDKLDKWQIDLLLVGRGWMTGADPRESEWIRIFESYNSSLFLRRTDANRADLERVAAYYREQRVPFSETAGFDPQRAWEANRDWAERFRIGPEHYGHFTHEGKYRVHPRREHGF